MSDGTSTREAIDEFIRYFRKQREIISNLRSKVPASSGDEPVPVPVPSYQKLCFLSLLDALESVRFDRRRCPRLNRQSRQRIQRFLLEYTSWDDALLVSLPVLAQRLAAEGRGRALELFLTEQLGRYSTECGVLSLRQVDLDCESVLQHCTTEEEEGLVRSSRHVSLFSDFRNIVVHEAREPGGAHEGMTDSEEPCYHRQYGDFRLRLLYPVRFFERLLACAVDRMEEHLLESDLDPYSLVPDTSAWA